MLTAVGAWAEEEVWYDASGEVVMTEKASEADRGASWQPSWVAREDEQRRRLRGGSPHYRPRGWWGRVHGPVYRYRAGATCRGARRGGLVILYRGGDWSARYCSAWRATHPRVIRWSPRY